jgi:hypothetical protein
MNTSAARSGDNTPIRIITIKLSEGTRDQFLDLVRKFAETYAFAIRIAPTRPDMTHFLIQLWREDLKAIGLNSIEVDTFQIGFYQNGSHPVNMADVDRASDGLKEAVSKIPGTIVSETR